MPRTAASRTRSLSLFCWGVLAYTLAVILWGAYVRATGSGAGCGEHWPLCNGTVLPRSPGLETLIEFSHRLTSGLSLLLIVGMCFIVFRRFASGHLARRAAVWSVVFIITEALIGAGLVLLGLVAKNDSGARAWSLAFHLANTFVLLGWLAATAYWAARARPRMRTASPGFKLSALLAMAGVILVGMSGGVAALGDTLFPSSGALEQAIRADFSTASHWLIRLRIWHPIIAISVSAYLLAFARLLDRRFSFSLIAVVLLQVGLGLLNVALHAPVWLQLTHLFLADLLWLILILGILDASTEAA